MDVGNDSCKGFLSVAINSVDRVKLANDVTYKRYVYFEDP